MKEKEYDLDNQIQCECFKCTNNATVLLKISEDANMNLCEKCYKNVVNNLKDKC